MLLVFVLPVVSFAQPDASTNPKQPDASTNPQPPSSNGDGKIHNPLDPDGTKGPTDIITFIHNALIGLLKIGIPVVALAIIYCGFLFVAARGKPEAITKARDALLYTIIGAAILLGSWAIANLIVTTVGGLA